MSDTCMVTCTIWYACLHACAVTNSHTRKGLEGQLSLVKMLSPTFVQSTALPRAHVASDTKTLLSTVRGDIHKSSFNSYFSARQPLKLPVQVCVWMYLISFFQILGSFFLSSFPDAGCNILGFFPPLKFQTSTKLSKIVCHNVDRLFLEEDKIYSLSYY